MFGATLSIGRADNTDLTLKQEIFLNELLLSNPAVLICLHCDLVTETDIAVLVEIDAVGLTPAVGLVHGKCLRPADRILGDWRLTSLLLSPATIVNS